MSQESSIENFCGFDMATEVQCGMHRKCAFAEAVSLQFHV